MAAKHSNLTHERLHKLYEYNPETGLLVSRTHNKPVGYTHNGYLVVDIDSKHVKVHRIAWMLVHGEWPKPMIDHINGDKKDNRLCNLREVNTKQNQENRTFGFSRSGLPKSGYKGVHWNRFTNKWVASIGHNKKVIYLGSFIDPQKASLAYREAAQKLHTHNEMAKT